MKAIRTLALTTAGFAYAVIVVGFIVRITNSGMGCGPDWPLCNGRLIPAFTSSEVVIEWLHRLAVLGLTGLTVAVAVAAWRRRAAPGGTGPGGTLRPAFLALGLLVVQSLVGAVTVKLDLPPHAVVLHLGAALALLATLMVLGLRAGVHGGPAPSPEPGARGRGAISAAVALAAVVILLGGVTATTGAAPACQGFPLCSGQLWPAASESGLAHIHWTHRLLAYALFFHLFGVALGAARRGAPRRVRGAAWVAFGLAAAQVAVGALMVLTLLPAGWRGLHAALGTGVWVALVYLGWLAARRTTARVPTTLVVLLLSGLAGCEGGPTPPDPGAPRFVSAAVSENPHNTLSAKVEIIASGYDSVFVRYWRAGGEPTRTPTYPFANDTVLTVPMLGLGGGAGYVVETWLIGPGRPAAPADTATFMTGILPNWIPAISAEGDDTVPGYVSLSLPDGPVIVDNRGTVVWYRHFPNGVLNSFQAHPNGRYTVLGLGDAPGREFFVMDVLGEVVGTFGCVGYDTRFHEVRVMAGGDGWLLCNDTRIMDLSAEGGSASAEVTATVVQHVGPDGALLFEWNAFDHFALTDLPEAERQGSGVNFTHGNSIEFAPDGHLVLSFRSLNEITKVNRVTGEVLWRFGGLRNEFTIERDPKGGFEHQHGVRLAGPGQIQALDNGLNPPTRFVRYVVDPLNRDALLVAAYVEPDSAYSMVGGSTDYDPATGRSLVSFGRAGRVVELDPAGNAVWRLRGLDGIYVFRAERVVSLYAPGQSRP